jgi:hypothetical protein
MKKITILFSLVLLVACSSDKSIEVGQKTSMSVNPVFNAGKVLVGEEIKAVFKVKNEGKYPLIISEVKGSCSCTVADYPQDPILPGKTGDIHATVKTENASLGILSKEVRVIANTEPSLTVMKVNGEVIRQ